MWFLYSLLVDITLKNYHSSLFVWLHRQERRHKKFPEFYIFLISDISQSICGEYILPGDRHFRVWLWLNLTRSFFINIIKEIFWPHIQSNQILIFTLLINIKLYFTHCFILSRVIFILPFICSFIKLYSALVILH